MKEISVRRLALRILRFLIVTLFSDVFQLVSATQIDSALLGWLSNDAAIFENDNGEVYVSSLYHSSLCPI